MESRCFLQYINYNAPKPHTCTSWKWNTILLSIPPIYYNAQQSHTSTSWEWKFCISFHSSNTLQCPKNYMYHVHSVSGKVIFFLFLQNINYNVQKLHTCPSWKWKFTFLAIPLIHYNAPNSHTCTSWSGRFAFLSIPPIYYNAKNQEHVHPGSGKLTFPITKSLVASCIHTRTPHRAPHSTFP